MPLGLSSVVWWLSGLVTLVGGIGGTTLHTGLVLISKQTLENMSRRRFLQLCGFSFHFVWSLFRILQRFSLIIQKIITLKNCLSLTGCEQPNPKLPSQTYRLRCHLQGRKNFEFALIFFGYLGWKGKLVAKNVIFILLLLIIARQVNRAYARETGCQRKVTGKHSPDMEYKRFGK